jgi:thioredoxin-related protein
MKVLLFSNDGCGSGRTWKPVFLKFMEKYHLEYEVINQYDPKNKELIKKYDVHGIPYTIFIDNSGNKIGDILGNMIEELADRDIKYYVDNADRLGTAQE